MNGKHRGIAQRRDQPWLIALAIVVAAVVAVVLMVLLTIVVLVYRTGRDTSITPMVTVICGFFTALATILPVALKVWARRYDRADDINDFRGPMPS